MLVLSRHEGDRILIGEVVVTVVRISGSTVRIGVEARDDIDIVRGELIEEDYEVGAD